ncbi:MAG: hypothetical protein Q4G08_05730, partial [Capnocytophaga sp.]|nr:hypothetical protein [Capnocytophaga sp.]
TGATGATGAAGTPGSAILSGNANPTATVGRTGDYYLNKSSGDLFGPKTTSGWGTPINLKGTANVVSTNWFAPGSWTGSIGDYYRVNSMTVPQPILNAIGAPSLRVFLDGGGTMLVYLKHQSILASVMLPYAWYYDGDKIATYYWEHLEGVANTNRFTFKLTTNHGGTLPTGLRNTDLIQLRYVLISPGRVLNVVGSNNRQITVDELKSMNYEQAGTVLGWEE